MTTTRANAGFDVLRITDHLAASEGGAAAGELHVFAYLACLMSIYDGHDPQDWSYGFAATPAGAPYAAVLGEECDRLRAAGRLLDRRDVLVLSSQGSEELALLRSFRSLTARDRYLEASCTVTMLRPLPSVADALAYEPQLQRALRAPSTRELLKPVGQALLDEHFRALSGALQERYPGTNDLLVAAAVWLSYLTVSGRPAEVVR